MAVLDLVDDHGQLAAHAAIEPRAEDRGDLVGAEPPQAELAAALERLMDGEIALEDRSCGDTRPARWRRGVTVRAGRAPSSRTRSEVSVQSVEPPAVMSRLSRSAAACRATGSATARKALSCLRKPIPARFSSCSMKL